MHIIRLKCNSCGHRIEVLEHEVYDHEKCTICQGDMILDLLDDSKYKSNVDNNSKINENATGDNFPIMKNIINKSFHPEIVEIEQIKKDNSPKISQEDIEDLKLDLELFGKEQI